MKRFLIISAINFFTTSIVLLATPQFSDILIIGNDTIWLQSFPLEKLINEKEFKVPFCYNGYSYESTACRRGYIATWEVVEDYLILKEVKKTDSTKIQLDITEYLKNNGYNLKTINGYVLADWYSDTLTVDGIGIFFENEGQFNKSKEVTLCSTFQYYMLNNILESSEIKLVFEKGKLIEDNLVSTKDYNIGDKLSLLIYLAKYKSYARIKGIVKENNGTMVMLEIFPLIINEKEIELNKEILENFWVNPIYCIKIE